jgi:hypothetical protein
MRQSIMATTTAIANPMERADELVRQMTTRKAMQLSAVYPMGLLGPEVPIHR